MTNREAAERVLRIRNSLASARLETSRNPAATLAIDVNCDRLSDLAEELLAS